MGPLSIVASQDIGDLGPRDSAPAPIEWRWYYHVPSLGLWGVLVALLVLVKPNRRVQAWLILLPVLAVVLAGSMLARLLSLPPSAAESFGGFLVALAAAWAAVWLLAPWLAARRVAAGIPLALAVMLVVGAVFFVSVCDFGSIGELSFWIVVHLAGALALVVATVLAARRCRSGYRPRPFMAWLLLWMLVVPIVGIPVAALLTGLFTGGGLMEFVAMLIMAVFSSLIGGVMLGMVLYLLNLPFLFLALRNSFYRERFQSALRLKPAAVPEVNVVPVVVGVPTLDTVLGTVTKDQ